MFSYRKVVCFKVHAERHFFSRHGSRNGAVGPSLRVSVYFVDAETLLAVVLECELGVDCLSSLDLSERVSAFLKGRSRTFCLLLLVEMREVLLCECPESYIAFAFLVLIDVSVYDRCRVVCVFAPYRSVGSNGECQFGSAFRRDRIRRQIQ
jgi:hypothetical protein